MSAPSRKTHRSNFHIDAISVLLLAFAIRIWRLDVQSLSGDEAFSVMNWTRTSLDHLLGVIALIDPQPPAALLSLYGWVRLVGDTEFAGRMLSAFASTVTVAAAYGISSQLVNKRAAILACILTASNPYQIWYAQDLRSYSLWMAFNAVTLWFMLRVLKHPAHPGHWTAYILSATISVYTFYLELFMLVAHNLFAIWTLRSQWRYLLRWFLAQLIIGLLLAPWFLRPELRVSGYEPTGGAPDLLDAVVTLTTGRTFPAAPYFTVSNQAVSVPTLLMVTLLATSLVLVWRFDSRRAAPFLTLHAFIPLLLLSLLAIITRKGYFNPRYTSASSLPFILIIATGLYSQKSPQNQAARSIRMYLALFCAGLMAILYTRSLVHYHFDNTYAKAPAWHDLVELLDRQTQPADVIIRNFPDPAFDYYYRGSTPNFTLPIEENAPAASTHAKLAQLTEMYEYLWLLPVDSSAFDQERTVATWLQANTQLISDQWVGTTRILQYASWESIPTNYFHLPSTDFAATARLIGYRITPPSSEWDRGVTIFVELFWKPYRTTDKPLTLFVHLLGPIDPGGSPLWAQDDHPPQHERMSSLSWPLNQPFRDVYRIALPPNAPPGAYTLTAGLYDPVTGERVPIRQGGPSAENNAATILSFVLP